MKKKKKKSAGTPKKAAKRATTALSKKAAKQTKKRSASRPKKQKPKPSPAGKGSQKKRPGTARTNGMPSGCTNPVYPDICSENFSVSQSGCVQFQDLCADEVTITQSGSAFPFSPYSTNIHGQKCAIISAGDWLTITVPAVNQTYPYTVSCTCGGEAPGHSVTVTS